VLEPEWLAGIKVLVDERQCASQQRSISKNKKSQQDFLISHPIISYFISYLRVFWLSASREAQPLFSSTSISYFNLVRLN